MTGRELKPHGPYSGCHHPPYPKAFSVHLDTPEIIATIHGEGYRFCGDLEGNLPLR